MFSSLQENDREIVINAMEERKYKYIFINILEIKQNQIKKKRKSEYIIRQGDDGDVLYILE